MIKKAKYGNKRRLKRRIQEGDYACMAGEEVVESGRCEE
jgi:hypothetical protein